MAIGDEDVAVRRCHHVGGAIEHRGQREQHVAVRRIEFNDLIAFAIPSISVHRPEIAVAIEVKAVCLDEHPAAEALEQLSGGVELENRGIGAVNHPDVAARVEIDAAHLAEFHSGGKLCPSVERAIGIRG
jgi:hypothetical protein